MIERWYQALLKREAMRQRFEAVQEEFDNYTSDIIKVIGQPTYLHFLALYLSALTANTSAHQ